MGATQFVVQDAFETMWCVSGSYASSLTPNTIVTSDDLRRSRIEVLLRTLTIGEDSGRLENDVHAEVAPRKRSRVALREHPHLFPRGAQDSIRE